MTRFLFSSKRIKPTPCTQGGLSSSKNNNQKEAQKAQKKLANDKHAGICLSSNTKTIWKELLIEKVINYYSVLFHHLFICACLYYTNQYLIQLMILPHSVYTHISISDKVFTALW